MALRHEVAFDRSLKWRLRFYSTYGTSAGSYALPDYQWQSGVELRYFLLERVFIGVDSNEKTIGPNHEHVSLFRLYPKVGFVWWGATVSFA